MTSVLRRAGGLIARIIPSLLDPAAEPLRILLYSKLVSGVPQVFARTSDGIIYQLTPPPDEVDTVDFLLDCDPVGETGAVDCTYTPTYIGNLITLEEWTRNDTTLIKSIDYTYDGSDRIITEVRKVFALDGTTILGQITWNYTYAANKISGGTMTRDV